MKLTITLPENYRDVNLGQYMEFISTDFNELSNIDKMVRAISILSDIEEEKILQLTLPQISSLVEDLEWMQTQPVPIFKKIIEIDGVKYGAIPNFDLIKVGEYVDIENYMDNFNGNLHNILSIIYRPITKYKTDDDYKIEDYDSTDAEKRAQMFLNKFNAEDAIGASLFFWIGVEKSLVNLTGYLEGEAKAIVEQLITMD
jgi:hypothetical protein